MPEGEPVLQGMFPINDHPAVILFDSGASHSFIDKSFVLKHNIPLSELKMDFHCKHLVVVSQLESWFIKYR